MGVPFKRVATTDPTIDKLQANIAALAAAIPSTASNAVTVNGDYTAIGNEGTIHVNAASGPVRITLPPPASGMKPLIIQQINGTCAKNPVTVTAANNAKTIAGASSLSLPGTGTGSVTLTCDGASYWPQVANASASTSPGNNYVAGPGIVISGNVISAKVTPASSVQKVTATTPLMSTGGAAPDISLIYEAPLSVDGAALTVDVFGPSGPDHSTGAVPDPGDTAGSSKFLREDGTWSDPPAGTDDHKVLVSAADLDPGYLNDKIVPVAPVTTTITGGGGGGGATSPPSGMKLWLKADAGVSLSGSGVTTWADQSGNGFDVSQANPSNYPVFHSSVINALPAIEFGAAGGQQVLQRAAALLPASSARDIFIVYQLINNFGAAAVAFGSGGSAGFACNYESLGGSPRYVWVQNIAGGADAYYGDGTNQAGVSHIGRWTTDGVGTLSFALDFSDVGALSFDGSFIPDAGSAGFTVGGLNPSAVTDRQWIGYIAEVLVYDHTLSPSDLLTVNQYLQGRYGIGTLNEVLEIAVPVFGAAGTGHSAGLVPDPGASLDARKYLCEDATWSIPARVGATSSDSSPDYLASKLVSPNSTIAVAAAGGGSLVGIDIAGTPSATLVYNYSLAGFNGLPMTNVGVFAGATQAYNAGQGPLVMSTSGASSADCEYGLNVVATTVTIRARIVRNDLSGGTGTMAFHLTRAGGIEATLFVTEGAGAQDLVATATVTGSADSDTWGLSFTNGTGATGGAFTGTITVTVSNG